jgi:hypothetical protein
MGLLGDHECGRCQRDACVRDCGVCPWDHYGTTTGRAGHRVTCGRRIPHAPNVPRCVYLSTMGSGVCPTVAAGRAEQWCGTVRAHSGTSMGPLKSPATKRRVVETDDGVYRDHCGAATGLARRLGKACRVCTTPPTCTLRILWDRYGAGACHTVRLGLDYTRCWAMRAHYGTSGGPLKCLATTRRV